MDVTDAIRKIIESSGRSARSVSIEMGRAPTYLATTLGKGSDVGAANLAKIAGAVGWRLVLERDGEEIEIDKRG